jgi:hypothetical protein
LLREWLNEAMRPYLVSLLPFTTSDWKALRG